jgi:Domain of unknown function (DUF4169)
MRDVINLRHARKGKRRMEAESLADANRVKHGRTKADKRLADLAKKRFGAAIEGARRERVED